MRATIKKLKSQTAPMRYTMRQLAIGEGLFSDVNGAFYFKVGSEFAMYVDVNDNFGVASWPALADATMPGPIYTIKSVNLEIVPRAS